MPTSDDGDSTLLLSPSPLTSSSATSSSFPQSSLYQNRRRPTSSSTSTYHHPHPPHSPTPTSPSFLRARSAIYSPSPVFSRVFSSSSSSLPPEGTVPIVGLLHSPSPLPLHHALLSKIGLRAILFAFALSLTLGLLIIYPATSKIRRYKYDDAKWDRASGKAAVREGKMLEMAGIGETKASVEDLRAYKHECAQHVTQMIMGGGGHTTGGGYFGDHHNLASDSDSNPSLIPVSSPLAGTGKTEADLPICPRTAIYLLDPDFGLNHQLLHIAILHSLAVMDDRAFFIDDSIWDRGRWEDHFIPTPSYGCTRPPRKEWKSCPRGVDHWVLTPRTHPFHFGHDWYDEFEDPKAHLVHRRRPMYNMVRRGFESILVPSRTNHHLIDLAISELKDGQRDVPPYLGVHLRRGDMHALSWKYRMGHIPEEIVVDMIAKEWDRLREEGGAVPLKQAAGTAAGAGAGARGEEAGEGQQQTPPPPPPPPVVKGKGKGKVLPAKPNLYLSSDSPSSLSYLKSLAPPGFRYYSLHTSSHSSLRSIASQKPYTQSNFASLSPSERLNLTRGMIVDQALLAGGWGRGIDYTEHVKSPRGIRLRVRGGGANGTEGEDGEVGRGRERPHKHTESEAGSEWEGARPESVLCGLSSAVCKLAAVQMGWRRSIEEQRWVNFDGREAYDLDVVDVGLFDVV